MNTELFLPGLSLFTLGAGLLLGVGGLLWSSGAVKSGGDNTRCGGKH